MNNHIKIKLDTHKFRHQIKDELVTGLPFLSHEFYNTLDTDNFNGLETRNPEAAPVSENEELIISYEKTEINNREIFILKDKQHRLPYQVYGNLQPEGVMFDPFGVNTADR